MRFLIIIIILFQIHSAFSDELNNDVNIYWTFPSKSFALELNLECKVFEYETFGIRNRTYLKYGSSMLGFPNFGVIYSFPMIGFTHFIGTTEGLEIGANYFRRRAIGSYNNEKGEPHNKKNEQHIGFEIGYREYYNKYLMIRYTFNPFYNLDNPKDNFNIFRSFYILMSISVGYSF